MKKYAFRRNISDFWRESKNERFVEFTKFKPPFNDSTDEFWKLIICSLSFKKAYSTSIVQSVRLFKENAATSFKPCFLAVLPNEMHAKGRSWSVVTVFGSAHEKLELMASKI